MAIFAYQSMQTGNFYLVVADYENDARVDLANELDCAPNKLEFLARDDDVQDVINEQYNGIAELTSLL